MNKYQITITEQENLVSVEVGVLPGSVDDDAFIAEVVHTAADMIASQEQPVKAHTLN